MHHFRAKNEDNNEHAEVSSSSIELTRKLVSALPECIILPHDTVAFNQSLNSYWAQQQRDAVPACVLRPQNAQHLCTAITILKQKYDERGGIAGGVGDQAVGLFTIRSGGYSSVPGSASLWGLVLIDLSLFCQVTISEDRSNVTIGSGADWGDVSKVLDDEGLAVAGGMDSAVGVGDLLLRGGISLFSPRLGFACSNIISYEVVLATGSIVVASESTNTDLWHALKGGSNNFGIVTQFTLRSFPCSKIWSGFLYTPALQISKTLSAFYDCVKMLDSAQYHDSYVTGPVVRITYVHTTGIKVISVNLVYTKLPENEKKWPTYWKASPFARLWRLWSTCKLRTLTDATDEIKASNQSGRRQAIATITMVNDPRALSAAHDAYDSGVFYFKRELIKGLVWKITFQPLLPAWACKGDANPLSLKNITTPLVIVTFNASWISAQDDDVVQRTIRENIENIKRTTEEQGTAHQYLYMNDCAAWQRPFEGYDEENRQILKEVSRKYDPDGLFQQGYAGGFKLW